jgi:hypothetical protein
VKPEEAQRNLHVAEKERDQWKQKYEVRFIATSPPVLAHSSARLGHRGEVHTAKAELDELVSQMEGL